MQILGAIAEFERERIRERVLASLQRARTQGKRLGRPFAVIPVERLREMENLISGLQTDLRCIAFHHHRCPERP